MMHHVIVPLLAGFLVGVNPFLATSLHARLEERGARRVVLETGILTALVAIVLTTIAWRFGGFISGRLTNGLLFLGLFALAGAFFSLRPLRRRDPDPPRAGWRWPPGYAGDVAYYAGPAWILATALAMQQVTIAAFALPFAAAAFGVVLATLLWSTRGRARLPRGPLQPKEPRTFGHKALAVGYGVAAVLMLAANLKLLS